MTTRTRLRPTGLAVALAASLGLIAGAAAATAVYASQPTPAPRMVVETVTVQDPCYVGVATDAVEAIKLSGRQGIALPSDNGEAYAYRLAECGK